MGLRAQLEKKRGYKFVPMFMQRDLKDLYRYSKKPQINQESHIIILGRHPSPPRFSAALGGKTCILCNGLSWSPNSKEIERLSVITKTVAFFFT